MVQSAVAGAAGSCRIDHRLLWYFGSRCSSAMGVQRRTLQSRKASIGEIGNIEKINFVSSFVIWFILKKTMGINSEVR